MPSKLLKFVASVFQTSLMFCPFWSSRGPSAFASVTVLLDPCCPQARKTVAVDRALPGENFFHRECVAPACFVETEQPAAHCRHHFRFSADYPALGAGRRKIGHGQRTSVRSDHVAYAASAVVHSSCSTRPTAVRLRPRPLRKPQSPR